MIRKTKSNILITSKLQIADNHSIKQRPKRTCTLKPDLHSIEKQFEDSLNLESNIEEGSQTIESINKRNILNRINSVATSNIDDATCRLNNVLSVISTKHVASSNMHIDKPEEFIKMVKYIDYNSNYNRY